MDGLELYRRLLVARNTSSTKEPSRVVIDNISGLFASGIANKAFHDAGEPNLGKKNGSSMAEKIYGKIVASTQKNVSGFVYGLVKNNGFFDVEGEERLIRFASSQAKKAFYTVKSAQDAKEEKLASRIKATYNSGSHSLVQEKNKPISIISEIREDQSLDSRCVDRLADLSEKSSGNGPAYTDGPLQNMPFKVLGSYLR